MIFVNFNLFSNGYIILNSKAAGGYAADGVSLLPNPPQPSLLHPTAQPLTRGNSCSQFSFVPFRRTVRVGVCTHTCLGMLSTQLCAPGIFPLTLSWI